MYATPTVVGDLLFVGSCSGSFFALDRASGKPRWSYDIRRDGPQSSFHGDPLVAGDLILTGTDNGNHPSAVGNVYAFEQSTGRIRWRHLVDGGTASDILGAGQRVYVIAMDHRVLCLDLADGKQVWSFRPEQAGDPLPSNPLAVAGGRVFCKVAPGMICALQADSGRVLWRRDLGSRVTTGLLVEGKGILAGTEDHRIHRLDQATGEVTLSSDAGEIMARQPGQHGDSLAFFMGQQSLTCVDRALRVRWRRDLGAPVGSSRPYFWGDLVLAGTQAGELTAFGAADGRPRWSHRFGDLVRGIAVVDGMLYVGTLEGKISAFAPPRP